MNSKNLEAGVINSLPFEKRLKDKYNAMEISGLYTKRMELVIELKVLNDAINYKKDLTQALGEEGQE